ncbi:MAG TPA: hypothetical protein VIO64_13145 [Pseudobacteroides sp.]|uniref:hypothetical protein n=1 Tax=Pseudobacteroides sp. TaxID=1968840 RepID=UPI002F94DA42
MSSFKASSEKYLSTDLNQAYIIWKKYPDKIVIRNYEELITIVAHNKYCKMKKDVLMLQAFQKNWGQIYLQTLYVSGFREI